MASREGLTPLPLPLPEGCLAFYLLFGLCIIYAGGPKSHLRIEDSASGGFSNSALEFKGGPGKCSGYTPLSLSLGGKIPRAQSPPRIPPQNDPNQAKPHKDSVPPLARRPYEARVTSYRKKKPRTRHAPRGSRIRKAQNFQSFSCVGFPLRARALLVERFILIHSKTPKQMCYRDAKKRAKQIRNYIRGWIIKTGH